MIFRQFFRLKHPELTESKRARPAAAPEKEPGRIASTQGNATRFNSLHW